MPTATRTYSAADDQTVTVDVLIGDGQSGGSAVYLGADMLTGGPPVDALVVGTGRDIRGRFLTVSTTVVDIRPEHDNTSVTVTMKGGDPAELHVHQAAVTAPGGSVNYLTVVKFV